MPKTATKRKVISKKAKTIDEFMDLVEKGVDAEYSNYDKQWADIPDAEATVEQIKSWDKINEPMSLTNKITLVLTLVNVAIVVYLTIKNIYV
jgi:hypothetical protein